MLIGITKKLICLIFRMMKDFKFISWQNPNNLSSTSSRKFHISGFITKFPKTANSKNISINLTITSRSKVFPTLTICCKPLMSLKPTLKLSVKSKIFKGFSNTTTIIKNLFASTYLISISKMQLIWSEIKKLKSSLMILNLSKERCTGKSLIKIK